MVAKLDRWMQCGFFLYEGILVRIVVEFQDTHILSVSLELGNGYVADIPYCEFVAS